MKKTAEVEKSKAILKVGYYSIVLDYDAASQVFALLTGAKGEVLESKYDNASNKSYYSIRPAEEGDIGLTSCSSEKYSVAKMVYAAELKSKGDA
jgi:hypothetical protein